MSLTYQLLTGDVREQLKLLPDGCVRCCVTSPPYWGLRDYGTAQWDGGDSSCDHVQRDMKVAGMDGSTANSQRQGRTPPPDIQYKTACGKCGARRIDSQIGLEATPDAFVGQLVAVFREVRRVLADDGTIWCNLGDSYATGAGSVGACPGGGKQGENWKGAMTSPNRMPLLGLKPKDLCGIPWRVAFALQADGWYLRSDIIWSKPNPMPESVTDRPTKAHEYLFLLSKRASYYYDAEAIKEAASPETQRSAAVNARESIGNIAGGGTKRVDFEKNRHIVFDRNKRSVWHVATQPFSDWTKTVRRVRVAPGDADGDTKRITSPDCPVHGDSAGLVANALYGEREDGDSSRTARTDGGHAPEQRDDCVPIALNLWPDSVERSSDSIQPSCSDSATERSSRSRRTARAPLTIAPCTASAETAGGTGGTSASLENAEPCDHMRENRSGRAASGGHLSAKTIDRIAHTVSSADSCTCELYKEITEEMSHFATYPEKLIEPCILAGTSEKGQCPACFKPWVRVVERQSMTEKEIGRRPNDYNSKYFSDRNDGGQGCGYVKATTLGWEPCCDCNAGEPIPDTVLDPFTGSGTTGAVALRHQRNFIGCELNPAYVELARRRIGAVAPLFAEEKTA